MDHMNQPNLRVQVMAAEERFRNHSKSFFAPKFDDQTLEFIIGTQRFKAIERKDERDGIYFVVDMTKHPDFGLPGMTNWTQYAIEHMSIFERSENKLSPDELRLQIALDSGEIALNKQQMRPGTTRFYLRDDDADARTSSTRAQKVRKALELIGNMSDVDRRTLAYVMEQPVPQMTALQIEGYVSQLAMEKPETVIAHLDPQSAEHYKVTAFLRKLLARDILRLAGGAYLLGDQTIGIDMAAAVQFCLNPKNKELVRQWKNRLKELGEPEESKQPETANA